MAKFKQGYFKPRHPERYKGNPTNIVYRSSWELKLMLKLDDHPDVIEWSSEGKVISYIKPTDGKPHRYYVDFYVIYKDKEGKIRTKLIEVKPKKQTVEPVKRKGMREKTWINEVLTWGTNKAKWEAARKVCAKNGWEFDIFTEEDLNILK